MGSLYKMYVHIFHPSLFVKHVLYLCWWCTTQLDHCGIIIIVISHYHHHHVSRKKKKNPKIFFSECQAVAEVRRINSLWNIFPFCFFLFLLFMPSPFICPPALQRKKISIENMLWDEYLMYNLCHRVLCWVCRRYIFNKQIETKHGSHIKYFISRQKNVYMHLSSKWQKGKNITAQ